MADGNQGKHQEDEGQDVQAKIGEYEQLVKTVRAENQGLTKRNSDLEKQIEELNQQMETQLEQAKQASMSDIEKLRHEMTRMREEAEQSKLETKIERQKNTVKDFLAEHELLPDHAKLIRYGSDDIDDQLQTLLEIAEKDRQRIAETFGKKVGQNPPKGGSPVPNGKTKKSEFTVDEASAFVRENGIDAWKALPK